MRTLLLVVCSCAALHAQRLDGLRCDGSSIPAFVDAAAAALERAHRDAPLPFAADGRPDLRAATGPLLAWLRLGRFDLAADVLAAERAALAAAHDDDRGDRGAVWSVLHHYWFARSTRDAATAAGALPLLHRALDAALQRAPAREFEPAVLRVQAALALGALHAFAPEDAPDGSLLGRSWTERGFELLLALERDFWCGGGGWFRARADAAEPDEPVPCTQLLPCWIGMLTTTGDKTVRNAHATLRRCELAAVDDALAASMVVVALTQLDGEERMAAVARLCAMAGPGGFVHRDGSLDVLATGAALDAVAYALTGLRGATAPDLDPDWVRCKPDLPPGARSWTWRGLQHDGLLLDLAVERRDDGALRTTLQLRAPASAAGRLVVVQRGTQQRHGLLELERPLVLDCPPDPQPQALLRPPRDGARPADDDAPRR